MQTKLGVNFLSLIIRGTFLFLVQSGHLSQRETYALLLVYEGRAENSSCID